MPVLDELAYCQEEDFIYGARGHQTDLESQVRDLSGPTRAQAQRPRNTPQWLGHTRARDDSRHA